MPRMFPPERRFASHPPRGRERLGAARRRSRATFSTAPSVGASGSAAGTPPRRDRFAREIAAVLVVKAIAILAIWLAFFSSPPEGAGGIDPDRVAAHIVAATPQSPHGRP
jgi:hypothetical protein